jgi:hypothetical protein
MDWQNDRRVILILGILVIGVSILLASFTTQESFALVIFVGGIYIVIRALVIPVPLKKRK